jgi:signal transduction histidine kinase
MSGLAHLRRAARSWSGSPNVVSHDLKSPLVTIRGFLGYVEKDARDGDLTRLAADIDRIRGATDRMGQLLDDLLELSRTGRIERPLRDVALRPDL